MDLALVVSLILAFAILIVLHVVNPQLGHVMGTNMVFPLLFGCIWVVVYTIITILNAVFINPGKAKKKCKAKTLK